MTTIEKGYRLRDLCVRLGVSSPWVKKIEGYLALKVNASGQRGRKSFYSEKELGFFRKAKALRVLGFGLKDVKGLFEMEMAIQNYLCKNFNPQNPDDSPDKLREKTNPEPSDYPFKVYLTSSLFNRTLYKNHISQTYKAYKKEDRVEAERIDKMYSEFRDFIIDVQVAAKKTHEIIGQELALLDGLTKESGR